MASNHKTGAFVAGAGLTWRRQGVLWWIFIVALLLAYFASRPVISRVSPALEHSFYADRLVHGFELAAYVELITQPENPLAGASAAPLCFAVVFAIFMIFSTGGILETYRRDDRIAAGEYFEACGDFFWRLVRLMILFALALIPAGILLAIVSKVGQAIDKRAVSATAGFWFELCGFIVVVLLGLLVRLWFDMAQVYAVAHNERKVRRALGRTFKMIFRNFSSLYGMFLGINVLGWIGLALGVWIWMWFIPAARPLAAFVFSQIVMLFWFGARLWQRASETAWYQRYETANAGIVEPRYPREPASNAAVPEAVAR